MPVPKTTIDLARIDSVEKLHARLAKSLRFPEHYGANLDALHDLLTESAEPRTVVFRHGADFWRRFPDFFPRLVQVFLDARDETEGLEVSFRP